MPKVPRTSRAQLRSHRSSAADRTRVTKKKKPYKVVFESITQEKKALHTAVSFNVNPPPGYSFVPSGNPDLTEYCKDVCRKQELDVHIVSLKPKNKATLEPGKIASHVHRIGHHFPDEVVSRACDVLGYYFRHGAYHKRDQALNSSRLARTLADYGSRLLPQDRPATDMETKDQIRAAVRDLFPKIPVWDLNAIVNHAFQEGTGRVGNAKDVPLARRVQLAVVAHIRHNYTEYDNLLKVGSWTEARFKVEPVSLAKLKEWRDENDTDEVEETFREVIVLDDDDEDESDVAMSGDERDSSHEVISSRATAREVQLHDAGYITRFEDRYARQAPAHEAQTSRMVRVPMYDEYYAGRASAGGRHVERLPHVSRAEKVYARASTRELPVNDVLYSPRPQERYQLRAPARIVLQPFEYGPTRVSYPYPAVQLPRAQARPLPPAYDLPPQHHERPLRMVDHGQEFDLIPIQEPFASPRRAPPPPPPRRASDQDLVLPSIEHEPQYSRRPAGY